MKILLLGGTADARKIAHRLITQGIDLIYSIAGLVRKPALACTVISGGFRQFGGMTEFLLQHKVGAILDATHPYASVISNTAIVAAEKIRIPCWRFLRPSWPQQGMHWKNFSTWQELVSSAADYKRPFVSVGQLDQQQLRLLDQRFRPLMRTAVKPQLPLPNHYHWIKAIGPFQLKDELKLMSDYRVDVLISKNSGGGSTFAKIEAARLLSIPIFMLDRPVLLKAEDEFSSVKDIINFTLSWCQQQ